MDLRKLKTLIDLVSESNVSELEITEAEGKVRIVKGPVGAPVAVAAPVVAAPAVVAVAAPFVLETDALVAVAETAGLQWVNSDADKIRAAQQAMASEPQPAHVPRAAKPAAAADNSPLVMVETRKDLSQVTLPFESDKPAA